MEEVHVISTTRWRNVVENTGINAYYSDALNGIGQSPKQHKDLRPGGAETGTKPFEIDAES